MSLPNPSLSFSPFAILLAEELNDMMENITALAAGTGLNDAVITTAKLANSAVTSAKVDFTTFNQTAATIARTVNSTTPQITATITVPTSGKYRLRVTYLMNDGGTSGQSDLVFSLRVNGVVAGGSDFVTNQSVSFNTSYTFEREFTWSTGIIQLEIFRNTGTKSISIIGSREISIQRIG